MLGDDPERTSSAVKLSRCRFERWCAASTRRSGTNRDWTSSPKSSHQPSTSMDLSAARGPDATSSASTCATSPAHSTTTAAPSSHSSSRTTRQLHASRSQGSTSQRSSIGHPPDIESHGLAPPSSTPGVPPDGASSSAMLSWRRAPHRHDHRNRNGIAHRRLDDQAAARNAQFVGHDLSSTIAAPRRCTWVSGSAHPVALHTSRDHAALVPVALSAARKAAMSNSPSPGAHRFVRQSV